MMDESDRIERLLALTLLNQMKGATQREKALQLSLAGFSNVEIADLLQTTSAAVSQVLYEARKGRPKKAKALSRKPSVSKQPLSSKTGGRRKQ